MLRPCLYAATTMHRYLQYNLQTEGIFTVSQSLAINCISLQQLHVQCTVNTRGIFCSVCLYVHVIKDCFGLITPPAILIYKIDMGFNSTGKPQTAGHLTFTVDNHTHELINYIHRCISSHQHMRQEQINFNINRSRSCANCK